MKKQTVRKRIFISNALMVLVTLFIFLVINVVVVEIYAESIETELRASMQASMGDTNLEVFLKDWTIHRNEFVVYFLVDGILCIGMLVIISQYFTKNLIVHIMEPLDELSEGAERIRNNDLSQDIEYHGDVEFEEVCETFNSMRRSILNEQERNRKYENARTDMIAGISHDLRTPLTAVRGTIKGLIDGVASTPEQQSRFLQTAYRRTGDMDVLLNQLFYLSKLETGNMPIELTTIDICEFIANYIKGKRELLATDELEIVSDTDGHICDVIADPEQLLRIFDNLLENSRKYAEVKPLKIKISLNLTDENVKVSFSDNGVGVAYEKLPYIFDEFYRGDESRNKKDGNGLGLYIVKYLTEAMGGSVSAESEDGFSINIFLKKSI